MEPLLIFAVAGLTILLAWGWIMWFRGRTSETGPAPSSNIRPRSGTLGHEEMGRLLDHLDDGVLIFNELLSLVYANASGRLLLGLPPGSLPALLPNRELHSIARRVMARGEQVSALLDATSDEHPKLRCKAVRLAAEQGVFVVLQDVTDQESTARMRRQFVSHASHELKTPVAGIRSLAEAIQAALQDDPEKARQFGDRLVGETERLALLLKDLLDLSRLEDPTSALDTIADVSQVAQEEADALKTAADARDITLSSRIEPGVRVRGDHKQLGLMIRNLLDNAIAYTPEGGAVSIEITVHDGEARIKVIDNGIGIALRDQARVFERFFRVDPARSRDRGGTGLGLAIVKHVADLCGGHVGVDSQIGEGSDFWVHLPLEGTPSASSEGE